MMRPVFLVIVLGWASMLQSQIAATVRFDSVFVETGSNIAVPVFVSTDSAISLAQFVVEFDSTVIAVLPSAGQIGSGVTGFTITNRNTELPFSPTRIGTNKNLLVQISGGGNNSFSGDSLEVLELNFRVVGSYLSESLLRFDQSQGRTFLSTENLNDLQGESINFIPGIVRVGDSTAPVIFDLLLPADSSWTKQGLPTFTWQASDDVSSGLAFYQLFINSALDSDNLSPLNTSSSPASELQDGDYLWHVAAFDKAGNARLSNSTWLLRVDRSPPTSEITNPNSRQEVSGTVVIQGTADDGSGIGVDSVLVSTDGGATWHPTSNTGLDFTTWEYPWNVAQNDSIIILAKAIDKLGNEESPHGITVTDVEEKSQNQVPTEFALLQNYPNPFNPTTTIEYRLPKSTQVMLRIYNIRGQQVRILVDEEKPAGMFKANWSGKDAFGRRVASGIYVYQIRAGEFVSSKKLILMR
ncbi:MAG: T9SS type A sorting domain-containing protein [bacterium]